MDGLPGGLHLGRRIRNVGRFAQIINVLAKHGFWSFLESSGIKNWLTPEQVRTVEKIDRSEVDPSVIQGNSRTDLSLPRRMREAIEELGPTFIKFGQMLASREDLLPESYIAEFSKLHKDVATIPYSAIRRTLAEDLGDEGLSKFVEISETPLAAGSIGQVHKATLSDGSQVVVKVQRPKIVEQIRTDLDLMEVLAGLVEKYIPELKALRLVLTVEEFARSLEWELDFIREAGNTTKISQNFSEVPEVVAPEVFWDLTSTRVLTLSYVEGYSITEKGLLEAAELDPKVLVERGLNMFLKMVFIDGLYHGDLHAGNLLALSGNKIGVLDFGLTVRLSRSIRESLAGLLVALVDEDYESLVAHFMDLANPSANFDAEAFEEAISNELSPFVGVSWAKIRTGKLLWSLAKVSAQHGAPLPRPMILFFRSLVSFEGVGAKLNPDFDIISTSKKFSEDLVRKMYSQENIQHHALVLARDFSVLAKHAPRQIRGLLKQVADGKMQLNISSKDLKYTALMLDRLMSRIAVSIILASLIVGSSILVLAKVGEEYFHMSFFGIIGFSIAGVLGLYVVWSVLSGGSKNDS